MAPHLVVVFQKRLHFPKLEHAVDAVDRWTAVDVEPMLEAEAFERKERFIAVCKIDCRFWHTRIFLLSPQWNGLVAWK